MCIYTCGYKILNTVSFFTSVFPNVPERPGMPCRGEDRKTLFHEI